MPDEGWILRLQVKSRGDRPLLVVLAFSSYRKNNKCQRCISFTKQAFRLQMKHLTDKSGISFTNIQFSIYKVAVWLTNLHLGFQSSAIIRGAWPCAPNVTPYILIYKIKSHIRHFNCKSYYSVLFSWWWCKVFYENFAARRPRLHEVDFEWRGSQESSGG